MRVNVNGKEMSQSDFVTRMFLKKKPKKPKTAQKRKARERHWRRSGVSAETVRWMKERGMV